MTPISSKNSVLTSKVVASLENQSKPVVLACTTSGGKSFLAVRLLEQYFKNKSGRTAVFLASNMTVLAQQFHSILQNACPVPFSFTYSMLGDDQNTDLKIGLPQRLINNPFKVSLLILDEAQWLWSQFEVNPNSMIAKILQLTQPEAVLLLTGSPAYFNQRKDQYHIHYLSFQDIPEDPMPVFSKVNLDLVPVTCRADIAECLATFFKSAKQNRDDISQLAVVAPTVAKAQAARDLLEKTYGLKCLISTSCHDSVSEHLQNFRSRNLSMGLRQLFLTI